MKIYIGLINGVPLDEAYTGLKNICEVMKIPYSTASKGKRHWVHGPTYKSIKELTIVKQLRGKANGNNTKNTKIV